jgi:hypothetical protein
MTCSVCPYLSDLFLIIQRTTKHNPSCISSFPLLDIRLNTVYVQYRYLHSYKPVEGASSVYGPPLVIHHRHGSRVSYHLADQCLSSPRETAPKGSTCSQNVIILSNRIASPRALAYHRRSPVLTSTIDASKFLAQSQSQIAGFRQPDGEPSRTPHDRHRGSNAARTQSRYIQRPSLGNPYSSQISNFPFASRLSAAPDAPLFHSALNDFQEEDDEDEREREIADFQALQKSRRVFGASRLSEGSETDADGSAASFENSRDGGHGVEDQGRGRGIRSSWRGGIQSVRERGKSQEAVSEEAEETGRDADSAKRSEESSKGKGKMVDVGLESTIEDSEPPHDLAVELGHDDSPPPFQQFRSIPKTGPIRLPVETRHREGDIEGLAGLSRQTSTETVPPVVATTVGEPPRHDVFWGSLYLICVASMFATFVLVWLHTYDYNGKKPLGDTIYSVLHSSFYLLAVDTVVAVIVSLLWISLLKSFVGPLVYLIVLAIPVILFSFSLYPLISSYKGNVKERGAQDIAMRWLSFIPGLLAAFWVYTVYKGRHALTKAIGILEFSSRILAANPALLALGFGTGAAIIVGTWVWLGMFTRVFLSGHFSSSGSVFIIYGTTWWLGVFFVLMYLWSLSIASGIQRATTAATVSQWYFHRNVVPSPSSREIVTAAFQHSTTTLFGTISLSTLLALLIRLPLLILPRRLVGIISIFAYSFIPTPIAALMNPLTLTYAAIHSQPLHPSARGLSQMTFLTPAAPTTTLTPRSFSSQTRATAPLLPYRLSKLILHATRFIMAIALGFGGWVATAHQLSIAIPSGGGIRGSAYAYVVGLVASFIGWGVLGAMEGVLSGIVDASVVCWGSEKGMAGGGAYCLEAGYLFGDGRDRS